MNPSGTAVTLGICTSCDSGDVLSNALFRRRAGQYGGGLHELMVEAHRRTV
jgi:hypothetical protein